METLFRIFLLSMMLALPNKLCNAQDITIVPLPLSVELANDSVILNSNVSIYADGDMKNGYIEAVVGEIGFNANYTTDKKNANIYLLKDKSIKNYEGYTLEIDKKKGIVVKANQAKGIAYALHTLSQLSTKNGDVLSILACKIKDEPAFGWRAYMLDESRHFHGKEVVKKLLDEMAYLKMNTFHWHLVDDPGWRIEIKKYPLLTEIGSKRDFSYRELTPAQWDSIKGNTRYYYTQDEIKEIVNYASERGIQIIPEIEVPAHASASISAYPWLGATSRKSDAPVWGDLYNVTDSKVEEFIHDVLDEVITLFPSKIVHIGGDEANYTHWQNNPEIQSFMKSENLPTCSDLQLWIINRIGNYLNEKGCTMIGWNEITGDNIRNEQGLEASKSESLREGTFVQFWDGDISLVNKAIDKGYNVVNSNRLFTYLDYSYDAISLEKAYSFNPIPDDLPKNKQSHIRGLGCQMWGEFIPTTTRLYYQTFPRIGAYAECGWTKAENKNYESFCKRMKPTERRWRKAGYFNQQPYYCEQTDLFTLWQLPTMVNTIGNSYVILTDNGKVIVMDGGTKDETNYLRGFLGALGNVVDCWFISHPHDDHVGAITEILKDPKGIVIKEVCHSPFTEALLNTEPTYKPFAVDFYESLAKSGIKSIEAEPGMEMTFGQTHFKILGIRNEDICTDYNNSSVVIKVWDPIKSVLFLGDTGAPAGDKLLRSKYKDDLDCDYMQMSHHGQNGVTMDFYRTVKFRACFWPTPSWVYNNDIGRGFNTHILKTIETRNTMDELGITEHYLRFEGLTKIK